MLINGSMLLGGIFIIVVGFAMIVLLLILIYAFIDIVARAIERIGTDIKNITATLGLILNAIIVAKQNLRVMVFVLTYC